MSGVYYEKKFWKDVSERVIATFAEVLSVFLVGSALTDVDWSLALNVSAGAGVAAFLKCLAAQRFGDDSASFVG
jgi:hypothetical protein